MKKAFLQLHFAVFLAGFTGILGRLITLNEGWLVWYRLLISSVTMWNLPKNHFIGVEVPEYFTIRHRAS